MKTRLADRCEYEGCKRKAEFFAVGRQHKNVGSYCETHADVVEDEGNPEYVVHCPNCGCGFGTG